MFLVKRGIINMQTLWVFKKLIQTVIGLSYLIIIMQKKKKCKT